MEGDDSMTGKERKRNLQLTRYIVCALMLGNGLLFAPTAEAENLIITGTPSVEDAATRLTISVSNKTANPHTNNSDDNWTLNYTGTDNAWAQYTVYGSYKGTGGGLFTLQNGTIAAAYGKYESTGAASGGIVNINGGSVGTVYGGKTDAGGDATFNRVTMTGGTLTNGQITGAGADNNEMSYNSVSIGGDVTIEGGSHWIGGVYATNEIATKMEHNSLNLSGTTKGLESTTIAGAYSLHEASGATYNDNNIYIGCSRYYTGTTALNAQSYFVVTNVWEGKNSAGTAINNTVNKVQAVSTIVLGNVNWDTSVPVLKATNGIVFRGGAKLDISNMSFANTLPSSGTMTLLSGIANDFSSGISVTGTAGTKSINSTTAKYVQKGTNTTNTANGVTLNYEEKAGYAALNSDKSGVTYTLGNAPVSEVTLGAMTWGTGRSGSGYTYNGNSSGKTDIDASNLTFTGTATVNPLSQPMTLLSDATGITGGTITQPSAGKGTVTAVFTDDTITYNGTTAKGTVSVGTGDNAGKVLYTLNSGTLSTINLGSWDGTASDIPTNWTGSNVAVATGDFTATPDENINIIETTTPGFFGDVTGTHAYTAAGEDFSNEDKGVTVSGTKGGGVKATNSGRNLTYFAEAFDVKNITLDSMAWGTPRDAGSAYNFSNLTAIDATNLSFTNPMAVGTVGTSTALLTNADGLPANFANITGASPTQNFTNAAADNGVKFNGTINGTVSTTLGQVNYTVNSKSITGIDLAGWDGNTSTALDGWTASTSGVAVKAEGFTAPTLTAGTSTNIFTTSGTGFFSDTNITGAQKYGPSTESSSDTVANVTFTGSQEKGVKAANGGQNLVYAVGDMTVSDITLGNMEVGTNGVVTSRTADTHYTFDGSTKIDATNLKFDKPADVADSTLVANATGITTGNHVTEASHSQAITNAAMGGGITASGTLHGTVAAATNAVSYTVNDKTISSMDLSGWDTTTENTTLPDTKWTGSNVAVSTGTFTAPTADKTIFTTDITNFFGDVTGAMAYTSGAAFSGDEGAGVTLSGTKSGGVKKSDDGKNLNFIAEARTVNNISLGNMTWGTGRAMPATGYTFSVAANGVDATNLKFSFTGTDANTIAVGDDWNLLTNANGLAADLVVKGSPVSQNISYSLANVATLGGTLTGKVKTYANTVNYSVTGKTLSTVDISGWDGSTTGAVNDTWIKAASGIAVTGSGFTTPTAVGDYTILTATPTGYFTGAQIADSIAYKTGSTFSETASNITLSGTQDRGVKVNTDGTALQYSIGKANINNIKIGNVTYTKNGTLINKSAALYDYSQLNSNGLDISSFGLSMTDEQKKSAATNDSMTLVQANTTLNDIAAKATGKSTYTYNATSGLAVKGAVTGAVAATGNNVVYTVTGNTASTLTFGTVAWNTGTYDRQASEIAYTGALVNADNITFTGTDTLNVGDTMVLVSNYGDSVNKISSGIFTLNGQTGKGHAYWNSADNNLYYVIDRAAGTSVPTVNAIGGREIVDSNPDYHNPDGVPGGQAEGDGEAKDNETIIKKSHIKKNPDGTGGDTNGGTSEDGDADENKLDIEESEIDGDATGGQSDTGNTDDNETIIKKSIIHGGVAGGETLGGHGGSRRNKTTVEESTVEGDVDGGKTGGDGETEENEVVITGSKIGGDVNGGHSGGSGGSKGNETTLDGTEVGGDVNGGKTDGDGETKGNEANVKNGSKVTGNVTGGRSGGNGDCTGNAAEVEGSEVGGDVNGGQSDGDGNTRENKTHVKDSKVTGNVNGGHSGQNDGSGGNGESTGNTAEVEGSEVGGNVNGGRSEQGNANKNESTVSGGSKVTGDVTGGSSGGTGNANENKTTVEGGSEIGGNVIGGQSNGGNTNKNETTVSGSTVNKDVIGGKTSGTGTSSENKTHVDGSNIGGSVIGGQSEDGDANKNEVSVTGGSTVGGDVIGGKTTGTGNANENNVNIDGGSTVNGKVYGGYSATGDASGNGIDIGNGKVNGDIYGGFSGGSGSTINNTITLHGGADVSNSNIIGGNNGTAGNTLNIGNSNEPWTGGSQSVKNISGFETLNYAALPWNSTSPALTISDGTSSDLSGTTITASQVAFTGIKTLTVGSTMTLLDQSNVTPASKRATQLDASGSAFTVGTATEGTGKLVLDANGNVVYQVESAGASRQTHNTVMAAEAAVVALNAGNDFILSAREGLARKENIGKDGIAVFAQIGGGATRQETGSHVNVNMWNGIVAVGRKNVQKESTTEYGVFVEHGWGNFSTHSDNAHRGDGSVDYTGGGLLGKWTKADGLYVEGSLRIGSMHEKANNLLRDTVRGYGYDERTTYKGFHLGVGKEFAIKDGNTVEVYGKYFYNRKDGMNFNAGLDEYNLDAVTSQILRVGACYTMKRERWNYYGDLSYEHELDGKAAGRANGMAIRGADTSGGSVRLELGAKLLANEKSPWTLDLNLTGYAGKKQGLQGGVSVKFMF